MNGAKRTDEEARSYFDHKGYHSEATTSPGLSSFLPRGKHTLLKAATVYLGRDSSKLNSLLNFYALSPALYIK